MQTVVVRGLKNGVSSSEGDGLSFAAITVRRHHRAVVVVVMSGRVNGPMDQHMDPMNGPIDQN